MQDQPKTINNKKLLITLSVVAIIIVIIVIGMFTATNIANSSVDKKQSSTELKASADLLKEQAIKAQKSGYDAKAVELLKQAKSQYESAGDKNNAVDAEALIHLINSEQ